MKLFLRGNLEEISYIESFAKMSTRKEVNKIKFAGITALGIFLEPYI